MQGMQYGGGDESERETKQGFLNDISETIVWIGSLSKVPGFGMTFSQGMSYPS